MLENKITDLDLKLLKEKYTSKEEFDRVIKKICEEEYPVQYAIGNVQFIDKIIDVDGRVLIPRFATEQLVAKTIEYVKNCDLGNGNMIDLCTGSGCIAISLASSFPNAQVTAVDKSSDALNVASKNAIKNGVSLKIIQRDVLGEVDFGKKFDVIISNPPYVKMDEEVSSNTKYEPAMALYPGKDDIIFYKKILDFSKKSLKERGLIAFEIGSTQAERISDLTKKIFKTAKVRVEKDFEGYDRFFFIFINC